MYNQIDGNSAAELNNDPFVSDLDERVLDESRSAQWRHVRDELLAGRTVYTFGYAYNLNELLINKYHKTLNPDYDFVVGFNKGELDHELKRMVQREADAVADIILGN